MMANLIICLCLLLAALSSDISAAPLLHKSDLILMSCTPALQTVRLGATANVECSVEFDQQRLRELSITHVPYQTTNMEVLRRHIPNQRGYRFSVIFSKVTEENGRQYCMTASGPGIFQRACYTIAINQPKVIRNEPQPPMPEITSIYTTLSSVEVNWKLNDVKEGMEFQTEVSVSTLNSVFGEQALPDQKSTIFDHLTPRQAHTVTVQTHFRDQTRTVDRVVYTTPGLSVDCKPSTDVTLRPYRYGLEQPKGGMGSLRIRCNTSVHAVGVQVHLPTFLRVKPHQHASHFRIVARRIKRLSTKHNGSHCFTAEASYKHETQTCINLNVTRPLAAVIQNVCRTRDCTSVNSQSNSGGTKKVIGCYVTGFPLPKGQVTWTYDGQPLSTETNKGWFRRILGCRNPVDSAGEEVRLCKLKVNSRDFLGINPSLLKCAAQNEIGSQAETSATAALLNKTE